MIEHVIFDLDGTLVDSAAVCVEIINEMLADRGVGTPISRIDALPHMSRGGESMVAALLGTACCDPATEIREFRRIYADKPTPHSSIFEGVRHGLQELREHGLKLSVCSNKPQHLCENVLRDLGLESLFDVVVGGCADRRPKPDRDLMDLVFDRIGAPADKCIFVGDSELDHAVAVKCGLPFMFVTYGYAAAEWRYHGATRYDHFAHVVDAIIDAQRIRLEEHYMPRRQASG